MLAALQPAERRVLLAHERAHLAHRHALLVHAVTLAAVANPLLMPVRTTVTYLVERWADEYAAEAVDDRDTTARALARAAVAAYRPACGTSPIAPSCAASRPSSPPRLRPIAPSPRPSSLSGCSRRSALPAPPVTFATCWGRP